MHKFTLMVNTEFSKLEVAEPDPGLCGLAFTISITPMSHEFLLNFVVRLLVFFNFPNHNRPKALWQKGLKKRKTFFQKKLDKAGEVRYIGKCARETKATEARRT